MPVRGVVRHALGSIPVVGAVTNIMNQRGLEKQKDKLKESFKKNN